MTERDWVLDLDEEEPPEPPGRRRRRGLLAGTGLLAAAGVVTAAALVGHGVAAAPARAAGSPSSSSAEAAPGSATTAAPRPPVIEARLADPAVTGGGSPAPLVIGTLPVQGGQAPDRVPHFGTCTDDLAGLQYLPVQVRMPENWLSATVGVDTTPATPAGIGRLGFFFQAGDTSIPCPGGAWSATDRFEASNVGQETISGYVVLDHAFGPATPQGRPDVFATLRLHVSNVRLSRRPAVISTPTAGSFCPGTDDELCAPLG